MNRLRVLISAHEFSPYQGSECAVGWNICTRLAAFHDVTVLCASGSQQKPNAYREAVTHYIDMHGNIPGLKIIFVDQPLLTQKLAHINRKYFDSSNGPGFRPLFYIGLSAWNRRTLQVALKLGIKNFDIVHQLTPVGFRNPGYLWTTDIPLFLWGPIGGMYKVEPAFAIWLGVRTFLFETLRSFSGVCQARLSRNIRCAVRKATLIWTITENEQRMVRCITADKAEPLLEAAAPSGISSRVHQYDGQRPLRICWSARHDSAKALPLLLGALKYLQKSHRVILYILGKGSETQRWQQLSLKLGLHNINWLGHFPHQEALQQMQQADVFVHTSIREATSTVVLEALALGLPVICHDICGMSIAVNDNCGIKVPLVNPRQSINGFRNALLKLLQNPALLAALSAGALNRASQLSWDSKVRQISEGYIRSYLSLGRGNVPLNTASHKFGCVSMSQQSLSKRMGIAGGSTP